MTGRITTLFALSLLALPAGAQNSALPGFAPAVPGQPSAPSVDPAQPAQPTEPGAAGKEKEKKSPKGDVITITSSGGAEVHQKQNLMIYLENVHFNHPAQMMVMTCDRLEVYRQEEPEAAPKPSIEAEAAQGGAEKDDGQPDIREAIAIGNVVIIKKNADDTTTTGRGDRAVFGGETRDVVLTGGTRQPELEVGDNIFYADTITLREDGQHKLGKNARTLFKPKKSNDEGGKNGGQKP